MSFQDRTGTSVASLLEILRTAQGDGGKVRQSAPVVPPPVQQPAQPPAQPPNAQLADLLAQLDDSNASASYTQRSSAFDGPSHGLIDPFGPVGTTPGLPRLDKGKGKRPAEELEEKADWGFTKCLPVLTELLRDEAFVKEVRKSDQDALERRLWARMEKIKAEHKARGATEREIARITRKPIPPDKIAQWDRDLKSALDELFTKQVIPSVEGLSSRQHARLVELGVPGLGSLPSKGRRPSEDELARDVRVKRIFGVLESVMDK